MYIAHERNMGGASKSLVTLATEMKQLGHKITVVIPFSDGPVVRSLRKNGITVKKIFFGWWMMPQKWNPVLKCVFRILYQLEGIPAKKIARLAVREQIDLIHSNSSAIDVGARAAKLAGLPHVWHFREFGDLDYRLTFLKGRKHSVEAVCGYAGRVIFISRRLRSYYQEEIPDDKCCVIYNGVSEEFNNNKYNVDLTTGEINRAAPVTEKKAEENNEECITFLISGNLHPNKRQDLALTACEQLVKAGCEHFRLIVAGAASQMADSKEYERELHSFAAERLTGLVQFTGFVSDMRSLRAKCDIELVCSDMEAFGRVTAEAMMSSNPVIAANSGANPELIQEGVNGLLFGSGDAAALAKCMQRYLENPGQIKSMGIQAYRTAVESFPSSANTHQLEAVYRQLTQIPTNE